MGAVPSIAARTAILIGLEQRNSDNDTVQRTANLKQIPIYNAFNPLSVNAETTELTRAKSALAGDGVAIGATSYAIAGEFYIFGSGIANLPPDYFDIIQACGQREVRTASIAASSATPASSESGTGGAMTMATGGYGYCYTNLFAADGTTPATTKALAAFESLASAKFVDASPVTSGATTGSAAISSLPSAGIKRLYRTKSGGGAKTPAANPNEFFFVAEIPDGTTSYTDTLADINLGQRIPHPGTIDVGDFAAVTDNTSGSLDDGLVYKYRVAALYDIYGAPITQNTSIGETLAEAAARAAYERPVVDYGSSATEISVDLDPGDTAALLTLPHEVTGVHRLYRTVGGGTAFFFLANVSDTASGSDTYLDLIGDGSLGHAMVAYADKALYIPVTEYSDFEAMTLQNYLDSRRYPAKSARGTFEFGGDTGANALARFQLEGVYNVSTKLANPTLVSNPGTPPQICGIEMQITAETVPTTDRTIRIKSIRNTLNKPIGARRDANASCDNAGVIEYMISGQYRPQFEVVFEVPKEIGDAADTDWIEDFRQGVNFALRFHIGTQARKRVYLTNWTQWGERRFLAQMVQAPAFEEEGPTGIRTFRCVMEWTAKGGVPGSEFQIWHY